MLRTSALIAALAILPLLPSAQPMAPTAHSTHVGFDEPIACPYCGGRFTVESFVAESGSRLAVRTLRFVFGG